LLQGENDRVVDNAAALEYLKAAGSQVTPHLLLQSGHVIPLDKDREQALQLITEFLAAPSAKDSTPSSALL
jgi:esterase/lipase